MFSAQSSSIAFLTVPMLMPNCSDSLRSDGIAYPGFHSPRVSPPIICRLTSLYSGAASGTDGVVASFIWDRAPSRLGTQIQCSCLRQLMQMI
jgi:hypothetical protein